MKETGRSEYGARLVRARAHAGVTQEDVVAGAGIPQSTLGGAEKTGKGSTYTVRIAAYCGVSPMWLETGKGNMLDHGAWPFVNITPGEYLKLNTEQRTNIENYARGMLNLPALRNSSGDTDTIGHSETLVFKHSLPKGKTRIDKRNPTDEQDRQTRRN